jgi:hypothetical protein
MLRQTGARGRLVPPWRGPPARRNANVTALSQSKVKHLGAVTVGAVSRRPRRAVLSALKGAGSAASLRPRWGRAPVPNKALS